MSQPVFARSLNASDAVKAPDEQRVIEATGNEGASFERAYHRAALVLWPVEQFSSVLLQAGVGAAVPCLAERVTAWERLADGEAERTRVLAIARQIVTAWESRRRRRHSPIGRRASRREMLALLGRWKIARCSSVSLAA